jgi:hypothetical protein
VFVRWRKPIPTGSATATSILIAPEGTRSFALMAAIGGAGGGMTELCTPGISVAVIDNFEGAWARSFGISQPE